MSESSDLFSTPQSELLVEKPVVLRDQDFVVTQEEIEKLKKVRFWARSFILLIPAFCLFIVPSLAIGFRQSPGMKSDELVASIVGLAFIGAFLAIPGVTVFVFATFLNRFLKSGSLEAYVKICQFQNWIWGILFFGGSLCLGYVGIVIFVISMIVLNRGF